MATPTSACASAGASFVPSPVMATSLPCACSRLMSSILASGRRLGEEVVDAGLLGDHGGGERVVAGDHHGADAHGAHLVEALADAALDDVLEVDHAERPVVAGDGERGAALAGDLRQRRLEFGRHLAPLLPDPGDDGVAGALAHAVSVEVDAAHARLRGELDEASRARGRCGGRGCRTAWPARRSSGPPASRRRARRAGRRRRAPRRSRPASGMNSAACRLPSVIVPVLSSSSVSTSPAASTARPDMASTLWRTRRSMPAMPIAESRPPIVVGIRQTSSAMSTVTETAASL